MKRTAMRSVGRISLVALVLGRAVGDSTNGSPHASLEPAQPSRCSDFAPRTLAIDDSFAVYVDSPEIARSAAGTFVFGWPAYAATRAGKQYTAPEASDSVSIVGAMIGASNTVIALPQPTQRKPFNPRPVVDRRDRMHLLWVDADSTGIVSSDGPIMWSRWLGTRWSQPDSVRATAGLGIWRQNTISPQVAFGPSVALVATFGVAASRTRAITLEGDSWVAHPMPAFESAYLSLATNRDTVFAVHLGYGAPDGNAPYATRSLDGGKTYSERVRLSVARSGAATDIRLLRLNTGRLVAVWVANRRVETDLLAAYSDDAGVTWRTSLPFNTGAGVLSMRAASTKTGKVVLIAQIGNNRRVVPTYLEWRDGNWSSPLPFIQDSSSSLGVANLVGGDSVMIAWGQYAPGDRWPVTKYVVLPGTCRLPS